FSAMAMWAFAFPIAEVLLQSWGTVALVMTRQLIGVGTLFLFWLWTDGWIRVVAADWRRGIGVGGIGFGLGSITFLVGQYLSDAVTPAIAASMMPIIGALLEVSLDGRRMHSRLLLGISLALLGGLMATGSRIDEANFGWGSLLCLFSVVLFAWGTRATTNQFRSLSFVGQTTITLAGSLLVIGLLYLMMLLIGIPGTGIGSLETTPAALLIFSSVASLSLAQFLWIRGASGLGILLASLHMNAVPFYVMVIVVLFLGESWNWWQAAGAAVVATGVILAQSGARRT
ncbi:MAG: DMT family transporter, partial [Gammaproteobacteria bacterium]